MIKFVYAFVVCGILLIGYSSYRLFASSREQSVVQVKKNHKLIDNGYFILLPKIKEPVVARFQSFQVFESDLTFDPVMLALKQEEIELFIIESLRDFILNNKKIKSAEFFVGFLKRPIQEIFNQYDLKDLNPRLIKINPVKSGIQAKINGTLIERSKYQGKSYQWGALQTKIFDQSLKIIKERVEKHFLTQAARKKGLSSQDFIETVLLNGESDLSDKEKKQRVSQAMRDSILQLPVKVFIKEPYFPIEFKPDWTPSLGKKGSSKKLIVFTDFYSQYSRDFFKKVEKLSQQFPKIRIGFRPIFPKQNQYQKMLAEMSFCIWVHDSSKYWAFLREAVDIPPVTFEKDTYTLIKDLEMNLPKMKQCFYKQEFKQVVDYHLKYAKFLKISAGPVIFIDGKIYSGGLSDEKLHQVLGDL